MISQILKNLNNYEFEASDQILKERYNERENTDLTVEEFRSKILNSESEKKVKNIKKIADKIVQNNCELKEFKRKIEAVIKDYLKS